MIRRTSSAVLGAAVITVLSMSAAAATTTTIGSVAEINANTAPNPSTTGGDTVQTGTAPGRSYVVPAGYGVITKLRHQTGTNSGALTFKVYRPAGAGFLYVVASETRTVTAGTNHSFDVRIPVKPGDTLGLSSATSVQEAYSGSPGADTVGGVASDAPAGQTVAFGPGPTGYYLDVAAVVESDADGDGYGDDTQDGCPTDARTFGKCAETTVTKAPKKTVLTSTGKARVKIKFKGADPAGTFRCSVDGGKAKTCKSPFKKSYRLGKHKVTITAFNAQGVPDLTPEVVKFKVKRKG